MFADSPTLQAWATIHVDLETTLTVPLNSLTEPTVLEALAHLETDDFMAKLHEVIKDCQVCLLKFAIEKVTLHHMSRGMPLLLLA